MLVTVASRMCGRRRVPVAASTGTRCRPPPVLVTGCQSWSRRF